MGKYFGTDGFRGEANVTLNALKAFQIGRYLGWYYGQKNEDGKARIDQTLCVGCGVCEQLCACGAIGGKAE